MGRKPLRILHTSDFHIGDSDQRDREVIDSTVHMVTKCRADLLIIAGDLFDNNRVNEERVRYTADSLQKAFCPVFIIAGNHDCLMPGSIFDRFEFWSDCTNIQIFKGTDGETISLPQMDAFLWGKSIDFDDRDVNPLEGMPQPDLNGNWTIAIAHGYYVNEKPAPFPSYHIHEEEIAGLAWDYIALGHVPRFQCLNKDPMTYYSGSPSITSTAALVEFSEETGVTVTQCDV